MATHLTELCDPLLGHNPQFGNAGVHNLKQISDTTLNKI